MHRWLRTKALGAALALTMLALSAATAFADPRDFELVNNTGQDIQEIYVGPSNQVDWGDNIIPDGKILPNGNKVPIAFQRFVQGDCLYDVKVVTVTGDEGELSQVNLCETNTVTFNK